MTRDPDRGRNLAVSVVLGIALAIAILAILVANADTLRGLV